MRHTLISLVLASLPLLAQNPTPKLSCEDRNSRNDRLVGHCEMKEQTLGAPRGAIQINPGMNGGVTVKGWSRGDVLVRARIETWGETDSDARSLTSQIRISSGAGQIQAEGPEMGSASQLVRNLRGLRAQPVRHTSEGA